MSIPSADTLPRVNVVSDAHKKVCFRMDLFISNSFEKVNVEN
jgi:hypothetical protein